MATGQANLLLSYIRRLAAPPTAQLSDRELLHRFAQERDETAFTALVRRHGPMVLNVARRVLHNDHDAEDVFQATFLVLLRKAPTLCWQQSVGNWLYEVAYRLALKAKTAAARRSRHEAQVVQPKSNEMPPDLTWQELQTLLDEELNRLPVSYRVPLILCYLEGSTRDEAAQRLGWSLSTLKRRLERGRELLRLRLVRRGLTVSAALLAPMLLQNPTQAALGPSLVHATVRTALQLEVGRALTELVSTPIAALVEGGLKTMLLTKLKVTMAMLLAAGVLAGTGALARQALTAQAADSPPPAANSPSADRHQLVANPRNEDADQTIPVSGRVLDPDGKPVAGAHLYLSPAYSAQEPSCPLRTTTAADGAFRFTVARSEYNTLGGQNVWSFLQVIATAEGFGPDWAKLDLQAKSPLTLRLVKDDAPITGRVLDLQGRPVAAADVRLLSLETTTEEDLTSYLKGWRTERFGGAIQSASKILYHASAAGLAKAVKTDAEGRFRLTGCGRERVVKLSIEAPTIETAVVRIIPRPAAEVKTVAQQAAERMMSQSFRQVLPTIYGLPFEHVAGPTKLIAGTVRDKETGKPVAGVRLSGSPEEGWWWENTNQVQAETDGQGHYQLRGLPKAKQYRLRAWPGEHSVYLSRAKLESGTDGLETMTVDFEMVKGVEIHGRISDKVTGKPVQTSLRYAPLQGNDNPGTDAFHRAAAGFEVKPDGTFRFTVPPGPGILLAMFNTANRDNPYTQARLDPADKDKAFQLQAGGAFIASGGMYVFLQHANAYRLINPPTDGKSDTYDMELDPGLTQTGTVLGPDGQPLSGAVVTGLAAIDSRPKTQNTATFIVHSLDPRNPRPLLFYHKERGLGGYLTLRGDEKTAATAKLEPLGTLRGRLLDEDGQPLGRLQVSLDYAQKFISRSVQWWDYPSKPITTDDNGYFRIEGIIAGLELRMGYGTDKGGFLTLADERLKGLSLRPGEDKDLGEIKFKRAQ
jgi:RNA polymerase sigma factor (sigma-70 family)